MSGELDRELLNQVMEMNRRGQDQQSEYFKQQAISNEILSNVQVTLAKQEATLERVTSYIETHGKRLDKVEQRLGDNEKAIMTGSMFDKVMSYVWKLVATAAGGTIIVWGLAQLGITK